MRLTGCLVLVALAACRGGSSDPAEAGGALASEISYGRSPGGTPPGGRPSTEDPGASGPSAYCADEAQVESQCTANAACTSDLASTCEGRQGRLSEAYLRAYHGCLDGIPCDGTSSSCVTDALSSIKPTPAQAALAVEVCAACGGGAAVGLGCAQSTTNDLAVAIATLSDAAAKGDGASCVTSLSAQGAYPACESTFRECIAALVAPPASCSAPPDDAAEPSSSGTSGTATGAADPQSSPSPPPSAGE
jgi:hypothetical protein